MRIIKLLVLLLLTGMFPLYATVEVAPHRLILSDKVRNGVLVLINNSEETQTFRISFQHLQMLENGGFKEVEKNDSSADDLIHFAPRQCTLQPHDSQAVRLILRMTGETKAGERRSNLLFQAIPSVDASKIEPETKNLKMSVEIISGISIPILIHHQTSPATVSLECSKEKEDATLACKLLRSGDESVHADVTVKYITTKDKPIVVGRILGISCYTPNPLRTFKVTLNVPPGLLLDNGNLLVEFSEGKKVLASTLVTPN